MSDTSNITLSLRKRSPALKTVKDLHYIMKHTTVLLEYQALLCPCTRIGKGRYKLSVGVRLSVCRVPQSNSRMERPRKTKIGRMEYPE